MKKIKGFTLIELIIVMAIMAILMSALMQLMKPIRTTYVDSTLYEAQRNTQTGIGQYLCETLRYASDVGIYSASDANVTDSVSAAKLFLEEITGNPYASMTADDKELENRLEIITIDQSQGTYTYGGRDYTGRIVRRKVKDKTGATAQTVSSNDEVAGSATGRLALGEAYYGSSDYTIDISPDTASNTIKFTVSSAPYSSLKQQTVVVSSETTVAMRNVGITGHKFNIDHFDDANWPSTLAGKDKVYIVFLLPLEN